MTYTHDFRAEVAETLEQLDDARGCVHVYEDGRDPTVHAPGHEPDDGSMCMPDGSFAEHIDGLRWLASEAADRIDGLIQHAEQMHLLYHRNGWSLRMCPIAPCSGLRRWLA